MHPEDVLVALGETAAVFAGFSGIIAVLGIRSVNELGPLERFRFSNLLVIAVAACLLALAPLVLDQFALATSSVWACSSAAMALFALIFLMSRSYAYRRMRTLQTKWDRPWMAVLSVAVLAGLVISQAANAMGWVLERSAAVYVSGVLALLVLSGLQFILLALDATAARRQ